MATLVPRVLNTKPKKITLNKWIRDRNYPYGYFMYLSLAVKLRLTCRHEVYLSPSEFGSNNRAANPENLGLFLGVATGNAEWRKQRAVDFAIRLTRDLNQAGLSVGEEETEPAEEYDEFEDYQKGEMWDTDDE